jgi:hypothetical protein
MAAIPVKSEYGPTLGQLLSPRWRAAAPTTRRVVIVGVVGLLALFVAAALTLEDAKFSHGGPVPFSFAYRDLYKTAPDLGGYVKVQRRSSDGRVADSFAVRPLQLPPYAGGLSGELPLYAAGYIRELRRRYMGFVLRGEGKTRVNTVPAYNIFYTAILEGRKMSGRDVLLLPDRAGERQGVDISMLTLAAHVQRGRSRAVLPSEVASAGVLATPLKSFTLG